MALFFKIIFAVLTSFHIATFGVEKVLAQTISVPVKKEFIQENFKRSILVISHEKILTSTNLGSALIKKLKESEEILRIEAEEIEKQFISEEQNLTIERKNLNPDEFLKISDDFDKRVEIERLNQRKKEKVIQKKFNKWVREFRNKYMIPVLEQFMQAYEASIVIDIDGKAFQSVISDSRINITDRVIFQMNASYPNIKELVVKITS